MPIQGSANSGSFPDEMLIATRNRGKVRELRSLLAGLPFGLRSLPEFPATTDVAETGQTFAENAALKASDYAKQTGLWSMADDSGLEVDALGGAPGIFSARYAGEHATDGERIERLLDELGRTKDSERKARFICVIAIAGPNGEIVNLSEGTCVGRITLTPRGANGFGYDPIFLPHGHTQTFGELSEEIKREISHRARALQSARAFLLDLLNSRP